MIVMMTAGIGTAMSDINSIIGIIVTTKHACLPSDYAKNWHCATSEECIGTLLAQWHLGKGCNPK
jgi:predicted membrane protein